MQVIPELVDRLRVLYIIASISLLYLFKLDHIRKFRDGNENKSQ